MMKLLIFLSVLFKASYSLTDPSDLKVLTEFREGLENPSLLKWPENDDDPCGPPSWPHVFCSGDRVSQIQAKNLGLRGTLPRSFNNLSRLVNVGLQGNRLSGELPSFRGLSELEFAYLDNNEFDSIPSDFFSGLTGLRVLALDRNRLNSTAAVGGWSIPGDLAESAQLTNLSLVGCGLVGPVPGFLGTMPTLTVLKLSYNRLSGEIPASFAQSLVQILWLNDQDSPGISGDLRAVASMSMLTQAWLHGNSFAGEIPESLAKGLPSLKELNLNGNRLVGLIPGSLAAAELRTLDLSNNLLVGAVPKFQAGHVAVSGNYFCRAEPGARCSPSVDALLELLCGFGYPKGLVSGWSGDDPCGGEWPGLSCNQDSEVSVINLPRRGLTGTLSPAVAALSSVVEIRISGNNLTGMVPQNLTRLKHLRLLDLSRNNLQPPLPIFPNTVKVVLDGNLLFLTASNHQQSPTTTSTPTPDSGTGSVNSSAVQPEGGEGEGGKKVTTAVAAVCSLSALALLATFAFKFRSSKQKRSADPESAATEKPLRSGQLAGVSVRALIKSTGGFAAENEVGRGGFGRVYRGALEDGTVVAVKRMEGMGGKAVEEFEAEVAVLSKVRHRNLVSLLGYAAAEGGERLLVYDYLPQGALSRHLFHWQSLGLKPLSWPNRLLVALDVARGMEYLHGLARETFIHRDLKPSNILLGDDFRARVADFGLVKLAPDGANSVATKLAGTFGYLAPEYAVMGKITTKADVFSFGVVLMELLTGLTALDESRPEESRYLANWFWKLKSDKHKLRAAVDPAVAEEVDEEGLEAVAELAGHCTARDPGRRPHMGHVVTALSGLVVGRWRPTEDGPERGSGIDYGQPLPQQLKAWQDTENDSIPARPLGFADSLTSDDAR